MTDTGTSGAVTASTTTIETTCDQPSNSPEQQQQQVCTINNNDVAAAAVVVVVVDSNCCSRVQVSESDLAANSDWAARWRLQDAYVNSLEQRLHRQEGEVSDLQQRHRCQVAEWQQREKVLVRRLAAKEQETHDLVLQLAELKTSTVVPTPTSLRSTYLDPAVNTLYTLLRGELHTAKARLDDTQHELAAWKFTPDSNTGKRLMAKCRLLHQENEELGRMTSSGRIAMLEGELALQKGFSEEVRQSQTELESFLADLEEDVEGMQSTIMLLQQELRRSKDQLQVSEKENSELQTQLQQITSSASTVINNSSTNQQNGVLTSTSSAVIRANGETNSNNNNSGLLMINGELIVSNSESSSSLSPSRTTLTTTAQEVLKLERTEDVNDDDLLGQSRTKRVRRSSVLSIDYECEEDVMDNDDDDDDEGMLVINSNGDVAMSDAD